MKFNFELIEPLFSWVTGLFNSEFGTALVGAFAGAYIASRIAERREAKSILQEQLIACNGAAALSIAIFQHTIGFKEQLSKPLIDEYNNDRQRYVEFLKLNKVDDTNRKPFEVAYNFGSLNLFHHNAEDFVSLVVLQCGAEKIATMAATHLIQTLHALDAAIKKREDEIARLINTRDTTDKRHFAHIYFGIPMDNGDRENRMLDAMNAICIQVDDTIFYSKFITERLSQHAQELASKIGRGSPKPYILNLDKKRIEGLLPDPNKYPDWQ